MSRKILVVLSFLSSVLTAQQLDISTIELDGVKRITIGITEATILDFWARKGLASEVVISNQQQLIKQMSDASRMRTEQSILQQRQLLEVRNAQTRLQSDLTYYMREHAKVSQELIQARADVDKYKAKSANNRTFTKIMIAVAVVLVADRIITTSK